MKLMYIGEVFSRFRVAIILIVGAILTVTAAAQPLGPVVTIPIEKVPEPYNDISEDGTRKSCGERLYGEWPAYLNYTNRGSYTIFTPGLQSFPSPQSSVPVGGRFRFYCFFNGIDTPNLEATCPTGIEIGFPDWYVEVRRRGPAASFTNRSLPPIPGEMEFTSTSTDPDLDPIAFEAWTFGDGGTGSGPTLVHRYANPGSFVVGLTVTDSDGLTNRTARTVVVPAPKLKVGINLLNKHRYNRIEIGETFRVQTSVTATDDGVGALSNVRFTGGLLTIPTNIFTVLQAPASTNVGTLQPGERRVFEWTLRADGIGDFALSTAPVEGTDAIARRVTGQPAVAEGSVNSMIVSIVQRPDRLVLGRDNNQDGETNALDRRIEIIVAVTNVSQVEITNVRTSDINEPIQLSSRAQDLTLPLTPVQIAVGQFGTVRPGPANAVAITNVYTVEDRVLANARVVVSGSADGVPVSAGVEEEIRVGGEVLIEARFDVVDRPYNAGQPVRLIGSIKNVSRFKSSTGVVIDEGETVGVVVYPETEGNGVGGYPFLSGTGGRTPDGPTGFVLKPDEEIDLEAIVPTSESPTNTQVRIRYQVAGWIHGEDGPMNARRADAAQIEVVEAPSEGWSAEHLVFLDGVPAFFNPCPPDECPLTLSAAGFAGCCFVEGLKNFGGGLVDITKLVGAGIGEIVTGEARLQAWKIWMMRNAIEGLRGDEAAQQRFLNEIEIDFQALVAVGAQAPAAAGQMLSSVDQSLQNLDRVLSSGDLTVMAGAAARLAGENPDMLLEPLVAARAARKTMLIREGAETAGKEALEAAFEVQSRKLAGAVDEFEALGELSALPKSGRLPVGLNVLDEPRVWRGAYGARAADIKNLLRVAREEGVVIAFRSRSPLAAQLIEVGQALLKPHGVSIKTVNELDMRYLGYPRKHDSLCVLVQPPISWEPKGPARDALVEAYLDRFPQLKGPGEFSRDLRASVKSRLEQRLNEWPKEVEKWKRYSKEGVDVDFYENKNGLPEALRPNPGNRRPARLERETIPPEFPGDRPRSSYVLKMESPLGSGRYLPITGDIDLLGIHALDGKPMSVAKRARIYDLLKEIGIQHGESFTFAKDPDARANWLRCCTAAGENEVMLAATPSGKLLTTQYIDELSVMDGGPNANLRVGDDEFAFLAGTMTEIASVELPFSSLFIEALDPVVLVRRNALQTMVEALESEIDRRGVAVRMGSDGLPEVYSPDASAGLQPGADFLPTALQRGSHRVGLQNAENEIVLALESDLQAAISAGYVPGRRANPVGSAGGQWQPVDAASLRPSALDPVFRIAPYTYLADDVRQGSVILPVLSDQDIGASPGKPLFAIGDRVVIDPGGLGEEEAVVASVFPFALSRPIENAHEIGTMILFLAGLPDASSLPGKLPAQENLVVWLRSDTGLELNGTNVVSWTDQSRNRFVFTAPEAGAAPVWEANPSMGVPSVRFESSYLVGNLGRTLSNATIFTLCRFTGGGNSAVVYAFGTRNFSGLMMSLGRRNGDGADHFDGAVNRIADDTIPGSNFRVFSQVYGGGRADRHQLMVDLQTVLDTRTTTGRAYSGMASNVVIGRWVTGGSHLVGDLVEWLVYDRVLSVEERFEVEEYLRQRAGLKPFVTPGSVDLSSSEIFDYDVTTSPKVSWSLGVANRELVQTGSGDPSIALSGYAGTEQVIRTKITPTAGSGAIGVVFGFEHRGLFHLFDWRQSPSNHVDWGMAPAGMRLRTFHLPAGQEPTGADLWSGVDPDRVTTWRANAVPWVAGREYEVVIRFGENQTTVEVNFGASNLETWVVPELNGISGQFGHYVNSMGGARFGPALLPGAAPAITGFDLDDANLYSLRWVNGLPPFVIESSSDLSSGVWSPMAPATPNYSLTFQSYEPGLYLRVRSAGVVPDVAGDDGGISQTFGNNGNLWRVTGTAPTRIEAENFDEGGSGVAYLDSSFGNNGGVYRAEHVDLGATGDFGGGYAVGWVDAGEWLQYTIRVETPGRYRLRARTARGASGDGIIRFLVDGVNKTGDMVVPSTGNWALYSSIESGPFELAAGTQILRVDLASGSSDLNWFEIVPDLPVIQTTFGNGGNPWSISSNAATRIEAENFDEGGEGVAYHDLNPQNAYGAYRAEAVDIGTTTDGGGGPTLGVSSGEWLEYTIHVQQAGEYRLRARTAQGASGTRAVRFLFDGVDKTGSVVVPPTGNWESYATVESLPFELTAGVQILRADITGGDFNLNWIEIVPFRRTTFGNGGNPWGISSNTVTRIEAENFDEGGPGVAYLDASPQNVGGTYRTEAVDIYATAEVGGGHTVGWIDAGEWLEYTIQVETAGQYRLRARTARGTPGNSTLRFLVNGASVTGDMVILDTGNWDGYTTVTSEPFALAAGTHILRADLGGGAFNLNWIEFVPDGSLVQTTFGNGGNPWDISSTAATRIEAENFDDGGPGIAYRDTTVQNLSGAYRPEAVDVGVTTDPGGGATVGWIDAGEWLEYTIRVETAGQYRLRARTARATFGNATLRLLVDGVDATGNMVVPSTGSWGTYVTVTSGTFALPAGKHVLRADMVDGGFDLNWIEIEPAE